VSLAGIELMVNVHDPDYGDSGSTRDATVCPECLALVLGDYAARHTAWHATVTR
jgi:hypothetical protein